MALCVVCRQAVRFAAVVPFEDILVQFSLLKLNFIFEHCTYVHGLTVLLIC